MLSNLFSSNTNKATAVGGAAGFGSVIAGLLAVKYHVPVEVTLGVFSLLAGLVTRWAAKLNPNT